MICVIFLCLTAHPLSASAFQAQNTRAVYAHHANPAPAFTFKLHKQPAVSPLALEPEAALEIIRPKLTLSTYAISFLLFGVCVLCSLGKFFIVNHNIITGAVDRVAMSVAIIPMSAALGYTDSDKGAVSSLFSLGYMCGLLPTGVLGSLAPPRILLTVGVLVW